MRFKVLKSGFDGIYGGNQSYDSINDAIREISYSKGWKSIKQLHAAIRKWANASSVGEVFSTQVSAIVNVGIDSGMHASDECSECGHDGLDYGDLDPVMDGGIQQTAECPECGMRWMDKFVLVDRSELTKRT